VFKQGYMITFLFSNAVGVYFAIGSILCCGNMLHCRGVLYYIYDVLSRGTCGNLLGG
jgi:hypothetical protein